MGFYTAILFQVALGYRSPEILALRTYYQQKCASPQTTLWGAFAHKVGSGAPLFHPPALFPALGYQVPWDRIQGWLVRAQEAVRTR